jgi:hypothetical protein
VKKAAWSNNESLALVELCRDEDVEAQFEGIHRNIAVYNHLAELMNIAETFP